MENMTNMTKSTIVNEFKYMRKKAFILKNGQKIEGVTISNFFKNLRRIGWKNLPQTYEKQYDFISELGLNYSHTFVGRTVVVY